MLTKKINLVQTTATGGMPLFFVISTHHPSSSPIVFVDSTLLSLVANGAFANDIPLFFITNTAFVGYSSHLSHFIISNSLLFTVLYCFSSLVTSNGFCSPIFCDLLSHIAGDGLQFAVFHRGLLSSMLSTGSRTLFLLYILSCTCCFFLLSLSLFYSFLSFLLTLLACNPTLFTGKRLFDQVFIIQKLPQYNNTKNWI